MRPRQRIPRGLRALVLASPLAAALPAAAAVITVGPVGCAHTTLASAVAAASEGDVIRIHRQYDAPTHVRIEQSMTLVGGLEHCFASEPAPDATSVLAADDPDPSRIIDVRGAGVVVDLYHLRLTGATNAGALNVQDGATVRVARVEIDGSEALVGGGAWLHGGAQLVAVAAPFSSLAPALSIHDNGATQGGGVYIDSSSLLEDEPGARSVSIWANRARDIGGATGRGGGVYMQPGARMLLDKGSLFDNGAKLGGAVYVSGRDSGQDLPAPPDLRVLGTMNLNAAARGGAVYVAASEAVEVELDRLFQNFAGAEGGGLWFGSEGSLVVNAIEANASNGSGGGIRQLAGVIRVRQLIAGNTASDHGGGVMATGGIRELDGGIEVRTNVSAGGSGGALAVSGAGETRIPGFSDDAGDCTAATPCVFSGNAAAGDGGAIWMDDSELLARGGLEAAGPGLVFESNVAGGSGGALRASNGARLSVSAFGARPDAVVSGSLWRGNAATTNGGAISVLQSSLAIRDARFGTPQAPNTANFGGAVAVLGQDAGGAAIELAGDNLVFHANEASSTGGGLVGISGARLELGTSKCASSRLPAGEYCSAFIDNLADDGAAIAVLDASLQVSATALLGNRPRLAGAPALLVNGDGATTRLENVLIADTAGSALGLIDTGVPGTRVELVASTIADNAAGILLDNDDGIELVLDGTLAWGNQGDAIAGLDGSATASQSCSLLEGGVLGALDLDPQFTATPRGPWRIGPASPAAMQCVDAPLLDLDGNPRSAMHDIGALVAGGALPAAVFADGFEIP